MTQDRTSLREDTAEWSNEDPEPGSWGSSPGAGSLGNVDVAVCPHAPILAQGVHWKYLWN